MWRKIVFDICFTGFCTALTTILPILFQYCYKYCYSDSRNLWAVMKAGGLALYNLIQPTISLEMPVPSPGHYGFHSFPVVDWFFLFIYLWVLTFPLSDCSEFGNFVITLIYNYNNTLCCLISNHSFAKSIMIDCFYIFYLSHITEAKNSRRLRQIKIIAKRVLYLDQPWLRIRNLISLSNFSFSFN